MSATQWRILISDDSPAMRSFIRRVIDMSNFGECLYFEASNGKEALDSVDRNCPDIVLTDINMPVMTGEEFLQELGRRPNRPPVIVVSTDSTQTRVSSMMKLGAASYLRKPFTPELMRQVLEETRSQITCSAAGRS